MNDKQLCCLRAILDYVEETEKKHYEESDKQGKENHIYNKIKPLRDYLKDGEGI